MTAKPSKGIQVSTYQVGSLVTINESFLNEPAGVIALVYENYDKPGLSGISLLTQNGVDLGGFSIEEQERYLDYWGDTGLTYNFRNVMQLQADWISGTFRPIFDNLQKYKHEHNRKAAGNSN